MPSPPPAADRIERLQRRRTRLALIQGLFFLIWQANYFAIQPEDLDAARAVNHVKIAAYVVWAALLLAFLATGGGLILPREVRAVLNDETTIDHRRRALAAGFWTAMAAAIGVYALALFEPVTAGEAVHVVLTGGIGVALLRFALLERRAQRDA